MNKVLKFKTEHTAEEGVNEVYHAFKEGRVVGSDKTRVIKWYKHLVENSVI